LIKLEKLAVTQMQKALLINVASVIKLYDMLLIYDVLCTLVLVFGFCVSVGVGVAFVFHLNVKKLDKVRDILVNGEYFNYETNEWEKL